MCCSPSGCGTPSLPPARVTRKPVQGLAHLVLTSVGDKNSDYNYM